jgi:hypothetical protein
MRRLLEAGCDGEIMYAKWRQGLVPVTAPGRSTPLLYCAKAGTVTENKRASKTITELVDGRVLFLFRIVAAPEIRSTEVHLRRAPALGSRAPSGPLQSVLSGVNCCSGW